MCRSWLGVALATFPFGALRSMVPGTGVRESPNTQHRATVVDRHPQEKKTTRSDRLRKQRENAEKNGGRVRDVTLFRPA